MEKTQQSGKGTRGRTRTILYYTCELVKYVSFSRLSHWLPRGQAHPEVVQGTAEFHHQIADALLPQTEPVFDDATALHTEGEVTSKPSGLSRGRTQTCDSR